MDKKVKHNFLKSDKSSWLKTLGKEKLHAILNQMILIRQLETRAEAGYQQGKIGGFFHAYMGQEAIQTAAVNVMGIEQWWITTYRCHALALLTGATPNEIMAEFYGKETGNAKGRGGSMHLYTDTLLGGFGIVGGHLPIATGAAFSIKYQNQKDKVAVCFMGDGAVAQGAVHESLNLASLWDLPCIYVIENNLWGMGTAVDRALAAQPIAEHLAKAYDLESMTLDGMDLFNCYEGFSQAFEKVKKTSRPIIIEAVTERFRGHSISDPGLYRSKDELEAAKQRDPINRLFEEMKAAGMITDEEFDKMKKAATEIVKESMKFAESSPDPSLASLEEGVFAPEDSDG
ncbi:MAG: pyruvate dehydrogenase (acetyl-transferring) E1 component subunit alpha [Candidatus Algichlamydia australiensis]|nr:pyruvate dehydrogenase (acetyl-transferring) E1 component subunit alpha [Chlamydiales bacterium]